ncbi:replication protein [Spartinivicinus marinus]|uniref:replication protein n=1 Tax=Spartinivicinus marinus TaxID=2994442 RepID=UPI0022509666|nr:replication protein [Spartinivicinus marinus]MCX4026983.1 replication protein [Spartinivicinus marinus]
MHVNAEESKIITFPGTKDTEKLESQQSEPPKKVKGFISIDNSLYEQLYTVDITRRQNRVLLVIIRKTIGFHKELDWVAAEQIKEAIQYKGSITHIHSDIRELKERKIIVQQGKQIGPNLSLHEWVSRKPKVTENGSKTNRKRSLPEEENKPKMVTKETENGLSSDRKRFQNKPKTVTTKDTNTKNNITTTSSSSESCKMNSSSDHPVFNQKPPATRKNTGTPMTPDWEPDWKIITGMLIRAGIPPEFAKQSLDEFRLYWIDSGEHHPSWQAKFFQSVKSQWPIYQTKQRRRQELNQALDQKTEQQVKQIQKQCENMQPSEGWSGDLGDF